MQNFFILFFFLNLFLFVIFNIIYIYLYLNFYNFAFNLFLFFLLPFFIIFFTFFFIKFNINFFIYNILFFIFLAAGLLCNNLIFYSITRLFHVASLFILFKIYFIKTFSFLFFNYSSFYFKLINYQTNYLYSKFSIRKSQNTVIFYKKNKLKYGYLNSVFKIKMFNSLGRLFDLYPEFEVLKNQPNFLYKNPSTIHINYFSSQNILSLQKTQITSRNIIYYNVLYFYIFVFISLFLYFIL